jgi:lipase
MVRSEGSPNLPDPFRVWDDVPVPGGTLRVALAGPPPDEAEAVVLAVHGLTSSAMAWRTIARDLGRRTRLCLVAPDVRGRGMSAALPGPYGMGVHVADSVAVLDRLGVERAVLAGHSMGAHVVALLAARYPERAAAVVLLDAGLPVPVPPGMTADQAFAYVVEESLGRLRTTYSSFAEYVALWRAHPALRDAWDDDLEAYVRYDVSGQPNALRSVISDEAIVADCRDLVYDETTRTAVDRVRAPLRLVLAPRGLLDADPAVPRSVVDAFATAHPEAQIEEIPDVNHYSLVFGGGTGPRRVAAVIEEAVRQSVAEVA